MDWAEFVEQLLPEPHTISVEPYEGSGAYGDTYGTAVEVTPCFVDHKRRLVRVQTQDAAGHEAVSSTTVFAPPGTVAPAGSRITLVDGTTSRVLVAADRDPAGADLPAHVELNLE
jgi:ribulose bisphosphate carboxylase small subunit